MKNKGTLLLIKRKKISSKKKEIKKTKKALEFYLKDFTNEINEEN
jgi:hypothetical protein